MPRNNWKKAWSHSAASGAASRASKLKCTRAGLGALLLQAAGLHVCFETREPWAKEQLYLPGPVHIHKRHPCAAFKYFTLDCCEVNHVSIIFCCAPETPFAMHQARDGCLPHPARKTRGVSLLLPSSDGRGGSCYQRPTGCKTRPRRKGPNR